MNERRRVLQLVAVMFALLVFKLWLVAGQEIGAEGSARFDDALFVELAHHIKAGDWLGPYNERTLVKGPAYPLWLAIVSLLHLPLLPAQHVLHALAAAAIAGSLRKILPHRGTRLALFVVLLFDPTTYETTSMRVTREGIYPALGMFVVAGLIELASHTAPRARWLVAVCTALGVALGAFWTTREEGPWILPAVGIALTYAAVRVVRGESQRRLLRGAVVAAVPALAAMLCVGTVAAINYRSYGGYLVSELKSSWFERAYGALTRVDGDSYVEFVPMSEKARELAYPASPAFAELRPFLDGTDGRADSDEFTLSRFGEMTGTWFVWAIRDAAASAGHHDTLPHARDFYLRVANEIDAACNAGRIPCGPARASLAPPWRSEYAGKLPRAAGKLADIVLGMRQVEMEQFPSVGGLALTEPFARLTHMRVEGPAPSDAPRGVLRTEALRAIRDIYATMLYPAAILAGIGLLAGTAAEARRRTLAPALILAWAILAAIAARLALLSYISVSAYPIYQELYLRVLYPLVYLFVALSAAQAWSNLRKRKSGPVKS